MKFHTKSFSTKSHMIAWFRDFKDEIKNVYEVGEAGEYKIKFEIK
tara:strand:+ start:512 stop:646 length:135 start_codon:yes stop_codon:yes gene_type:complete